MINNLEDIILTDEDVNNLQYVEPYWNKTINKEIKRANKWTFRFKGLNEKYDLAFLVSKQQLPKYSEQVSAYKRFLKQRYEMVTTNLRFIRKFSPFITGYCTLYGFLMFFSNLSKYFKEVDSNKIDNNKKSYIKFANSKVKTMYDIFKKRITSRMPNDDYIKLTFDNMVIINEKVQSFQDFIFMIISYTQKLLKKKKTTETDTVAIVLDCFEFLAIVNSYNFQSASFSDKLR